MLAFLTVVIMLAVGYAYMVEGLFTACTMCINVFLSGLLAFNFFEPLARLLEDNLPASFLTDPTASYADAVSIVLLFSLALFGLRTATNQLANVEIDFPPVAQRIGGAAFGMVTGYLISGMLLATFQTLPMYVNFMGFNPDYDEGQAMRRVLPSDRVWLALMHRAGTSAFSGGSETFDQDCNFELRYARYRRYDDTRGPMSYYGEFGGDAQPAAEVAGPVLPGGVGPGGTQGAVLPRSPGPTNPETTKPK